jgi:hypothetical protein
MPFLLKVLVAILSIIKKKAFPEFFSSHVSGSVRRQTLDPLQEKKRLDNCPSNEKRSC